MSAGTEQPAAAAPAAPARPRPDPRQGHLFVRMARGFGYLFEGWGFVLGKHPSLIKHCLMPLAINLLVFVLAAIGLYYFYGDLVNLIWARPGSWFLRIFWYLFYVFIFLLVILIAYVGFFVVQAILSAPFNDLLSERVEQLVAGETPPPFSLARFSRIILRTVLHELARLGIWIGVMLPLFLLNLVLPFFGPLIFLVGGFYVTATFFGYTYLDYSMSRREWSFGRKWKVLLANRGLTFGFGSSLATALLVPVAGILCVPMAAVGGTLMFCDLERAGAFLEPGPVQPQKAPASSPDGAAPPPAASTPPSDGAQS
jgi:CysZ protein